VREWEDMVCEFGIRRTGSIDCPYGFHPVMMRPLCGKLAIVVAIQAPDAFTLLFVDEKEPREDSFSPVTFNPLTWANVQAQYDALNKVVTDSIAAEITVTKKPKKDNPFTLLQGGKK
jgi:hypothetical protein